MSPAKHIIITGASRGIGEALAKSGSVLPSVKLLLLSRNEQKLETLCQSINKSRGEAIADFHKFDLSKPEWAGVKTKISEHLMGRVDVLINNAGFLINKAFEDFHSEEINRLLQINFTGPFLLTQHLASLFAKQAHIVNIGSMGGFQGSDKFPGLSVYSASKAALSTWGECLAVEWRDRGIAINTLAIGAAQTEMLEEAFPGYQAPVSATEMADFILDFSINGSKYFNGKVIPVSLSTP